MSAHIEWIHAYSYTKALRIPGLLLIRLSMSEILVFTATRAHVYTFVYTDTCDYTLEQVHPYIIIHT